MDEHLESGLTPISKLGEFGFIEKMTESFTPENPDVLRGVGDDAAVYAISEEEVHVVSTDLLAEGVHFDLTYAPLQHVGYKSVVVNLSDIYAMNAIPFGITVSVAMSSRFTVEAMEAFYSGVKAACDNYGVDLLGGDTSSCHAGLVVSITALGKGKKDEIVYRKGAQANDLICVSGDLGAAYAGLQLMEREKSVYLKNPDLQPDLAGYDYVVGRQLKPEARRDVVEMLRKANIQPTAMIDVSDGLASDLLHICRQSKVGVSIYEEKLMIDHQVHMIAEEFNIPALTMALNGGEDYELLFTVPLDKFDEVSALSDVKVIGHVVDETLGANIVTAAGGEFALEAQGWNHFSKK